MKKRILVADDEPDLVEIITAVLEKPGWEIQASTDGRSTIRALEQTVFDLVFLDLLLPEPDGFDILCWIRRNESTKEIPVIIISGRSQENTITRAKKLGANQFIIKPFDFEVLRSVAANYLSEE